MICEDDAILGETTERLESKADLLAPFDLLFANGRMAALCAAMSAGRQASIPEIYTWVASKGGPKKLGLKPSPGADCYVITARGAERLLALTAEQKIICGVDWAMIWNALGKADDMMAEAFPELAILRRHLLADAPALTAATREGRCYEVDVRLRPGGQGGPLCTSLRIRNVCGPVYGAASRQGENLDGGQTQGTVP